MSRRGNPFAVLSEDYEAPSAPAFSFGPSLLDLGGGGDGGGGSGRGGGGGGGSSGGFVVGGGGASLGAGSVAAQCSSASLSPAASSALSSSSSYSLMASLALPPAAPAPAPAPRGSAALDLASITHELLAESRALPAAAAAAAWDFSGLAVTAEEETRRTSAEAQERQRSVAARVAAAASDRDMLRERMQTQRTDLPRGARRRILDAVDRGEDHGGRLEAKVYKRSQASRARNKARALW